MNTHIIKTLPCHFTINGKELRGGIPEYGTYKQSDFEYSIELPHFINAYSGKATAIIKHESEFIQGDEIQNEYDFKATVTNVSERRKAKGNWSTNTYDQTPDFVSFEFE